MHEKSRYSFTHCFKQIFVHVFTQVLLPTPNRQDFDTKAPHPDHYADVTNKRWRLLQSILAFIFMYNECKWRCGIHLYIVYGSDTVTITVRAGLRVTISSPATLHPIHFQLLCSLSGIRAHFLSLQLTKLKRNQGKAKGENIPLRSVNCSWPQFNQ